MKKKLIRKTVRPMSIRDLRPSVFSRGLELLENVQTSNEMRTLSSVLVRWFALALRMSEIFEFSFNFLSLPVRHPIPPSCLSALILVSVSCLEKLGAKTLRLEATAVNVSTRKTCSLR